MKRTNYEAPHYAVFSSLLLLPFSHSEETAQIKDVRKQSTKESKKLVAYSNRCTSNWRQDGFI